MATSDRKDGAATGAPRPGGRTGLVRAAAARVALFAALWLVLTGEPRAVWPYGMVTVALALAFSLAVLPPREPRLSAVRALALLPVLAAQSLVAGLDVARRALSPRLAVDPGFVEYRLRSRSPALGIALAYLVTMLPGSLAVDVRGDRLLLHVIDRRSPIERDLARMEARLCRLLGLDRGAEGAAWRDST